MQMVKKVLLLLLLLWAGLIVFMPKESLYYTLEKRIAKEGIEINEAQIEEGIFDLILKHPVIYVHGIKVATLKEIRIRTLLFYNRIKVYDIEVDKSLQHYLPPKADTVWLTYTVLRPLQIAVKTRGSFGKISGVIRLWEKKIHLDVSNPEKFGMLRGEMKKGEQGWYYETSF